MHSEALATVGSARISLLRNGLRIMALRALGDGDAAEDVVQEVLLRALRAVTPEIAADQERLGAFVGGIARHVIADARRAAARTAGHGAAMHRLAAERDPLGELLVEEERRRIREAMERLSSADLGVVRASFYEGLTPAEIAERLNEPVERIRKRKSRALARLRALLLPSDGHDSSSGASTEGERIDSVAVQGGG